MTDYTTVESVESHYLGAKFEASSDYLTDTIVGNFITEQSLVIDFAIKKKYTLPITDADDLTYLKLVCDKMVVCKIDKILRQNAAPDEEAFRRNRGYCKQAKEMLDKILNGEIELEAPQSSFKSIKYNKTEVSTDDEECCR